MSEQNDQENGELDEREVATFLHDHPDFFSRHESLLLEMTLPHPQNGQAISLVERQVGIMREQKQQLRDQLHQLTLAARTNEQLMARFQQMILNLIDSVCRVNYILFGFSDERATPAVVVGFFFAFFILPASLFISAGSLPFFNCGF